MSTQIKTIFSPALAARFDRMVTLYPLRRSALIPMLLYAQDEVGYLSPAVISEVAARIGITELDVRDVITYYSLMRTTPGGQVSCTGMYQHQLHVARWQRAVGPLQTALGHWEQGNHAG